MTGPVELLVRRARPAEEDAVIDFLIRGRAHISGSRRRAVFRAVLRDSYGDCPRTTVAVGEVEHQLAAGLVLFNSDLPSYYRRLPWRHPLAAGALLAHRIRKRRGRRSGRRAALRHDPGLQTTAAHANTPEELLDDERLQQPPRPADQTGPHATDQGPDISYCVTLIVDPSHRGQGFSKQMVVAATHHAKSNGANRYDCSFAPEDPVACRLYLSLPFDIQRFSAGYFASLDLSDIEPKALSK